MDSSTASTCSQRPDHNSFVAVYVAGNGQALEIGSLSFQASYLSEQNKPTLMYILPKDLTTTRADAIWFAENSVVTSEIPGDISYPPHFGTHQIRM
jgi:hypothetical protein